MTRRSAVGAALAALFLTLAVMASAGDWSNWRGPHRDGTSDETGLVSSWSVDGENLIWKAELTTRVTPIVFDGRACVSGRTGRDLLMQELVACFDAGTGEKLWERRFPVYNTTVPFSRVGWASLAGDPETGYVYAQNVDGQFIAFDRDGGIVWQYRLGEELGRASGFGGRTLIPLVDGDRVIIGIVGAGWGDIAAPRQRYMAFDKRTGTVLWLSTPGQVMIEDFNNNGSPAVATIDGRRVVVGAGADGWVHAVDAGTGRAALALRPEPAGAPGPGPREGRRRLRRPQRGERRHPGGDGPGGGPRRHGPGRRHRRPPRSGAPTATASASPPPPRSTSVSTS